MRLIPRSIRGRLLAAGVLFTGIALLVASLSIGSVLDRFVRRGLDDRLDAQIALLVRAVRADGTVDVAMLQEIGPFTQYRRGWAWRIETPRHTYTSQAIVRLDGVRREGRPGREGRFRGGAERLQSGQTGEVHVRTLEKRTPAGLVRITSAAPRAVLYRLRQAAIVPVLLSMISLSVVLLVTTVLQLRIGLKPLGRLRQSLAQVRAGGLARIPADQPAELAPVVEELNGLLDENEAALARARGHVSNLAHSLKTPLATLSIRLAELDRDPDGQLGELVAQIDGAIRHHLGRARAASPGAPGRPVVMVATVVEELQLVLGRIHAERAVTVEVAIPSDLAVKCDPQDLTEMLGNLLDNAWKWTASRIAVTAGSEGRTMHVSIEDDGPGLSGAAMEEAMVPGKRLDEREDGHGFGLPIARELAELHGGRLELAASVLGGLKVTLFLPADLPVQSAGEVSA
jgi:signal transduction histidine kinase